jgi:hypothetical protein
MGVQQVLPAETSDNSGGVRFIRQKLLRLERNPFHQSLKKNQLIIRPIVEIIVMGMKINEEFNDSIFSLIHPSYSFLTLK